MAMTDRVQNSYLVLVCIQLLNKFGPNDRDRQSTNQLPCPCICDYGIIIMTVTDRAQISYLVLVCIQLLNKFILFLFQCLQLTFYCRIELQHSNCQIFIFINTKTYQQT